MDMRKVVLTLTAFLLLSAIATPVVADNPSSNPYECGSLSGEGTKQDPFRICRLHHIPYMEDYPNAYFILDRDIDLDGWIFPSIPYFNGTFNANGYTISNLKHQLFQTLGADATVKNLRIEGNLVNHGDSGMLAHTNHGTIDSVHVSGSVSGTSTLGGIVANNEGTIRNSQVDINMSGRLNIGGIAAVNGAAGKILVSESQVNINGSHRVGSIAAINHGKIIHSSASGSIHTRNGETGGIAGVNASDGSILASLSHVDIHHEHGSNVGQIAGFNDGKVRGSSGFGNLHGSSLPANTYYLYTTEDLELLHQHPDAHFKLAADLSIGAWTPVEQFSGILDGQNHILSNLQNQLFDTISSQGLVKNVKLANVNIHVDGYVTTDAILAGDNYGTIDHVHVTSGNVSARWGASGLVGTNYGTVRNSKVAVHVASTTGSAGIVGGNFGQILNVEFTGSVTGDFYAGAIAANNGGLIENAVADGQIRIYMGYGGGLVAVNDTGGEIRDSVAHGTVYYYTSGSQTATADPLVALNNGIIANSYGYGDTSPFSY